MTKDEQLLVIAMEECAEIQQAISKALRFGMDNYHPSSPEITNGKAIWTEISQFNAVIQILIDNGILPTITTKEMDEMMEEKTRKVNKYIKLSQKLGLVSE